MARTSSSKGRASKTVKKKTGTRPQAPKQDTESDSAAHEKTRVMLERSREQLKAMADKIGHAADKGMHDTMDSTRKQLVKLGDLLHDAKDKGAHIFRDIAEEVHRFATEATDLTKLKLEIHNMKKEREGLLILMGEKLKNLYHSNELKNVGPKFRYDLERLDKLESDIEEKEQRAAGLSTELKNIR